VRPARASGAGGGPPAKRANHPASEGRDQPEAVSAGRKLPNLFETSERGKSSTFNFPCDLLRISMRGEFYG